MLEPSGGLSERNRFEGCQADYGDKKVRFQNAIRILQLYAQALQCL
jgi:hypothetical protein